MAIDKLEQTVNHNKAVKKLINDGPPGTSRNKDIVSFSLFNNKTGKNIFSFSLFKKDQSKAIKAIKSFSAKKPRTRSSLKNK